MILGGRAAAVIAVGACLATLTVQATAAAAPARTATAAGGQSRFAMINPPGSSPAPPVGPTVGQTMGTAAPTLGSLVAREVGGPLMASQGVVVRPLDPHALPLPDVPASAWVIANADTGQVLAAKDPHGEFGPASTLKVLTAVTLIPLLNPDAMVIASKFAASQEEFDIGLVAGRAYKVSDLFDALLLISANDAAVALTEAAGSFAKGMTLINAEARHLQAYDVDAKLPNGLPASGQVTSAYDEALIARQALAMPSFMHYDSALQATFEVKPHDFETITNQNYLLTKYRGGIGGKIGWTISSEATYVGLARRNGVTLIATVLHCTSLQEITSAERLLNWGFAMNGKVSPVGVLVPPVATATAARHAQAANARRHARAAHRPATVALAASRPGSGNPATSYALAAVGVAAVGIGLGGLVRTRRRRPLHRAAAPLAFAAGPRARGRHRY
jgi:serine-type D-Ala-D-Ala carboxypeptidase (penicillin-binding protein 5/6)